MAQAFLKSAGIFLSSFLPNFALWILMIGKDESDPLLATRVLLAIAGSYLLIRKGCSWYLDRHSLYHNAKTNVRRYAFVTAIAQESWNLQAWFALSTFGLLYKSHLNDHKMQFLYLILALVWIVLLGNTWVGYMLHLRQAKVLQYEWHKNDDQ